MSQSILNNPCLIHALRGCKECKSPHVVCFVAGLWGVPYTGERSWDRDVLGLAVLPQDLRTVHHLLLHCGSLVHCSWYAAFPAVTIHVNIHGTAHQKRPIHRHLREAEKCRKDLFDMASMICTSMQST